MVFKRNYSLVLLLASFTILLLCTLGEFYNASNFFFGYAYIIAVLLTYNNRYRYSSLLVAELGLIINVIALLFAIENGSANIYLVVNHSGTILSTIIAFLFVRHVKEIKQIWEAESKQATSLIDNASEGIILTNKAGKILLANPYALQMFGYDKHELNGQHISLLIPDNIKPVHDKHLQNFHANPSNRSMGIGRDLFAKKKDNSVFPVEISLSYYQSGGEPFVIAFVIDITVRKQAEAAITQKNMQMEQASAEIKQLNASLEQKIEDRTVMLRETLEQLERSKDELAESLEKEKELGDLKSRFVSTVSHEFRTPLSTILSSASLIGKYIQADEQDKRDRHVNRIKESVKHMNNMLEDLLLLGKLEEGLTKPQPEVLNIATFMQEFVDEMQELAKPQQQILLQLGQDVELVSDRRLLKHVLLNLVSNAIKFSPDNGEIAIRVYAEQGKLYIAISDHGIGIEQEDQQHLFERFFRAKSAQNIQGTGLGLHIVGKYIELLQGKIELQSELGKGTTFIVTIPINTKETIAA